MAPPNLQSEPPHPQDIHLSVHSATIFVKSSCCLKLDKGSNSRIDLQWLKLPFEKLDGDAQTSSWNNNFRTRLLSLEAVAQNTVGSSILGAQCNVSKDGRSGRCCDCGTVICVTSPASKLFGSVHYDNLIVKQVNIITSCAGWKKKMWRSSRMAENWSELFRSLLKRLLNYAIRSNYIWMAWECRGSFWIWGHAWARVKVGFPWFHKLWPWSQDFLLYSNSRNTLKPKLTSPAAYCIHSLSAESGLLMVDLVPSRAVELWSEPLSQNRNQCKLDTWFASHSVHLLCSNHWSGCTCWSVVQRPEIFKCSVPLHRDSSHAL